MPKQNEGEKNKDDLEEEEEELEELLWRPDSGLTDEQIDQFIIISRSVGTFARALDCSSSVKQPSLHMSAAAASRDITVFHAYQVSGEFFVLFVMGRLDLLRIT
jgi:metastasis-associated protein MTA